MSKALSTFDVDLVTEAISSYLSTFQISQCAQVCRVWRRAFEPIAAHWIRSLRIDINNAALFLSLPSSFRVTDLRVLDVTAFAHKYAHRFSNGLLPVDKSISALNLIGENPDVWKMNLECLLDVAVYLAPNVLLPVSRLEYLTSLKLVLGCIEGNGLMQAILEHCPASVLDLDLECNVSHRDQPSDTEQEQSPSVRAFTPAFSISSSKDRYALRRFRLKYRNFFLYRQTSWRYLQPYGFLAILSFLERCLDLEEISIRRFPREYVSNLLNTLANTCPKLNLLDFIESTTKWGTPGLSRLFSGRAQRPGTRAIGGTKISNATEEWVGIRNLAINCNFDDRFDPQAIPALINHSATTLQVLRFRYHHALTASDLDIILLNCSSLRELRHHVIAELGPHNGPSLDSLASSSRLTWACHDTLEVFEMTIVDGDSVTDNDVFEAAPRNAKLVMELWKSLRSMPRLRLLKLEWGLPSLNDNSIFGDYDRTEHIVNVLLADKNREMSPLDIGWMGLFRAITPWD
ncbi:hypothetical protein BGX27_008327 [Mortierella sp. AM989]|nr:hypothetical protein BGX27_008327 [Mortierella sp. AM989]